ncbi:MAG TPA: SH3 domain-containing protein [Casimicrobiaceae bacterium]
MASTGSGGRASTVRSPKTSVAVRALLALLALPLAASAAEFRATLEPATVLYDAPSARGKPLYVYGRDVPVETLVDVEGWTKVRDAAGTIGWMQNKALSDKRMLIVRAPSADVRASADDAAPIVFRAERDVLLELAEPAASPAATSKPGWVKVRHRDGPAGYVRLALVFGF